MGAESHASPLAEGRRPSVTSTGRVTSVAARALERHVGEDRPVSGLDRDRVAADGGRHLGAGPR